MPHSHTVELFEYKELSEAAKAKARDWFISGEDDSDLLSEMYEQDMPNWGLSGVKVLFSLGYSQSDDLNLEGCIDLEELANAEKNGGLGGDDAAYYTSPEYVAVCKAYKALKESGAQDISAEYRTRHHGGGSLSTYAAVRYYDAEGYRAESGDSEDAAGKAANELEEALTLLHKDYLRNRFMRMGYDDIEGRHSDEAIAEMMEANGYTFLENGERFG